ncbi:MAG TPA: hypothetical protein VFV68_17395, partial [Agriterribacter sp.]|nr:hypothetical protein [Agriterribacter sp.]
MKILLLHVTILWCCARPFMAIGQSSSSLEAMLESRKTQLPNGWQLSPAGSMLPLGDLPLNMAVSSSKKLMAVTNNGQSVQSIQLIDLETEKVVYSEVIPKSWYGLSFSNGGKFLYASGGNDNMIRKYAVDQGKLILADSIILGKPWPVKISPTGLTLASKKQLMYIVTKENNTLYVVDIKSKSILKTVA